MSGRAVWVLLALALVLRLAFVAATPNYFPRHDDRDYDRLACAIVQGGGYPAYGPRANADTCGAPNPRARRTAFRPPLWPATLAGVYAIAEPLTVDRRLMARIANALLGTLAVALMGFVATRLWGRRVGLLALAVGATWVPLIVVGGSLLTETLFTVLELAAVAAVVVARSSPHRLRWALVAGFIVGLTALARTNGLVIVVPLALGLWGPPPRWSWRALAPVAALTLAVVVAVAPWTIRNARAMDAFVPVATETGSALAGTYNRDTQEVLHQPRSWKWPHLVPALQPVLATSRGEIVDEQRLIDVATTYIAGHPEAPLLTAALNTTRLFGLTGGPDWWRLSTRTMDVPDAAGPAAIAWLALAAPFVLLGAYAAWRRRGPPWLWLVALFMLLSAALVVGELRFRAPVDPFLVLLAALGLDLVATWFRPPADATRRLP